jgi:hypothetical protein
MTVVAAAKEDLEAREAVEPQPVLNQSTVPPLNAVFVEVPELGRRFEKLDGGGWPPFLPEEGEVPDDAKPSWFLQAGLLPGAVLVKDLATGVEMAKIDLPLLK